MVGQKHGRRMALPDLERLNVKMVFVAEDINQHLGGIADLFNRAEGMTAADQGKIGNGIKIKQIGAGNTEKIGDHMIGGPGRKQLGEAVKNIEGLLALGGNDLINLTGKRLKTFFRIDLMDLDLGRFSQQRQMVTKAHVVDSTTIAQRLLDKGLDKIAVIIDRFNLKHDIITNAQAIENSIQFGIARRYPL